MKNKNLYFFSLFLVAWTAFLILAGGLVTSHDAGLAVLDWPLSYGQFFPPMVGNIFWEHGHRMIAGLAGIFTLVLAIWIQMSCRGAVLAPNDIINQHQKGGETPPLQLFFSAGQHLE